MRLTSRRADSSIVADAAPAGGRGLATAPPGLIVAPSIPSVVASDIGLQLRLPLSQGRLARLARIGLQLRHPLLALFAE